MKDNDIKDQLRSCTEHGQFISDLLTEVEDNNRAFGEWLAGQENDVRKDLASMSAIDSTCITILNVLDAIKRIRAKWNEVTAR